MGESSSRAKAKSLQWSDFRREGYETSEGVRSTSSTGDAAQSKKATKSMVEWQLEWLCAVHLPIHPEVIPSKGGNDCFKRRFPPSRA